MKKFLLILAVMLQLVLVSSLCFAEFELGEVSLGSSGMDVHGYYEFELWDKEHENTTFDAHKIVIWMGKTVVPDKVYISAEFEYEHFPRLNDSKDSNTGGDGEFKLDSATVSITPNKTCRFYAGVYYVPFGIEYESYPGHKNKMITRPYVMKGGGIIPGTWSDVGIGVEHKVAGIGKIDVYTMNGDAYHGGISRDSKSTEGGNSKSLGARLSISEAVKGLNIGGSYVSGRYAYNDVNDDITSSRWGAHIRADLDDLVGNALGTTFICEVVGGKDESMIDGGVDTKKSGLYVQLSASPIAKLDVAIRHDIYDDDTEVDDNENDSTSFGVGYEIYDHTKLKAEYQINNEGKANEVNGEQFDNDLYVVGIVVDW